MIAHITNDEQRRTESVAEHTRKTVLLCQNKGNRLGIPQIMTLCAVMHDMGKEKKSMRDYLLADDRTKRQLKGTIAHASTGAKYFSERYQNCSGSTRFMVEMITYAVAAHHGLFDCVDRERTDRLSKKLEAVADYEEAVGNAERDYLMEYALDQIFAEASDEFRRVWSRIKEIFDVLKPLLIKQADSYAGKTERLSKCKFFLLACQQRLMLSVLVDSDWEATSGFMRGDDKPPLSAKFEAAEVFGKAREHFACYMQDKQQSARTAARTEKETEILDARTALLRECIQFAEHPAGVYCLPIPTGGGKTLSSLAYALEYCKYHPKTERIIYVSPFISVTEQNAQVFREAIGNDEWILEHHSSVVCEAEESEDYRKNQCRNYEIDWSEPFICTTFVQFMNTLFSDQSASVRRMHRLANSVVILDEVQSMPLKCVHTFNYMVNFLTRMCNTNLILCTATQPALAETTCPICYSSPKDMIKNASGWFRKFERVRIELPDNHQKYTFASLGDEIAEQITVYPSILVVLNTKSAVRKLYDILQKRNVRAEYLTTNLCAEHRSDKLHSIQQALGKRQEPIVVVSTNLIEAGVDISFTCVYRAMAGLDSLAQTAGRCNRNGELECGVIRLITLEGENTGNMEELQQNIRVTESIIYQYRNSGCKGSLLMPEWMEEYYRQVYFGASESMNYPVKDHKTNIVELLSGGFGTESGTEAGTKMRKHEMNQAYKTAGRAYQVIDDHTFGVIVPYKKGAKIIEALQEASDVAEIKGYIREAQRYTVNVRESQLKKLSGLIQQVCDRIPGVYMTAAPGAYNMECGIVTEWEALII